MKATIVIAASLTIFFGTPAAASQNQVVNGGFETGNFDGWDQVGDKSETGVYHEGDILGSSPAPVTQGQFAAAFGPLSGLGGITQTIDTTPGKSYDVSFDIANTDIHGDNQFSFSFDDGYQIQTGSLGPFGFQTVDVPVTASGLSADVTFLFTNPGGFFLLDNVSVNPLPEPASWTMLLGGFAGIGVAMRRRKPLVA